MYLTLKRQPLTIRMDVTEDCTSYSIDLLLHREERWYSDWHLGTSHRIVLWNDKDKTFELPDIGNSVIGCCNNILINPFTQYHKMTVICLKEAQTIQDEYFAHAMEILESVYDSTDCSTTLAQFYSRMQDYSPRENVSSSRWKAWLNHFHTFVYGLTVGKEAFPYTGFSFEQLKEILKHECMGSNGSLSLFPDNLVTAPIVCQTCCECACGQCSPCGC